MTKTHKLQGYLRRSVATAAVVCLMALGHAAYGQSGKVTVPATATTLKQALDEIGRQTNYRVSVHWNYLDPGKRVSLPAGEMEIKQLLTRALDGTDHTWEVIGGNMITITYESVPGNGRSAYSAMVRDDFRESQARFIPDPWSRTQKPFENMMNTRIARISADPSGHDSTSMVVVNFRVNSSVVERDYMDNAHALDMLGRTFQRRDILAGVDYIVITAGSSPEGSAAVNEKLAGERALAVKSYIMWKFPFLDRDMIYTFSIGEDWTGLRKLVGEDLRTPDRDEVLALLDSPRSTDAKKAGLKTIGGGRAYSYIAQNMLPKLRGGAALTLHYKEEPKATVIVEKEIVKEMVRDTVYVDRFVEPAVEPQPAATGDKKPLFALKTNLLFDAASALNVEVEVPIGQRWSIAGEFIFPWWLWDSKQYCLQSRVGTLEARYWMGNRTDKLQLTGWFVGLHAGMGSFDVEWKDKGYQGNPFYMAGLSGGYAHTIGKTGNWRMEYSLGLGFIRTEYDEYAPQKDADGDWHLIRQKTGNHTWIGPTRAKVSLVWMLNHGYKKGGVK